MRGFTLIEMVIVGIVLSVLATVGVVGFNKHISSAHDAAALAVVVGLGDAVGSHETASNSSAFDFTTVVSSGQVSMSPTLHADHGAESTAYGEYGSALGALPDGTAVAVVVMRSVSGKCATAALHAGGIRFFTQLLDLTPCTASAVTSHAVSLLAAGNTMEGLGEMASVVMEGATPPDPTPSSTPTPSATTSPDPTPSATTPSATTSPDPTPSATTPTSSPTPSTPPTPGPPSVGKTVATGSVTLSWAAPAEMVTSYEVYRSALDAYTAVYPSVAGVSWQKVATVPSTATSTTLTMPANQHQADLAVGVANDGAALLGYNFYVVAVNLTSSSTPSNVVSVITGFKGKSGEQLVCKDPHTNSGVFLIDLPETWGWPGEVDYIIPTTVSDLHGKSGTGAYQAPLSSLNVTVKSQTVKSHGNGAVLYTINTPDPIVPDATTKVCPS